MYNIPLLLISRLNAVVYYDDLFKKQFKERAESKVTAIMAAVDQMYSQQDSLKTIIDVNTVAIVHAPGKNWGDGRWDSR